MSKGSRNRTADCDAYAMNYDRIFRKREPAKALEPMHDHCCHQCGLEECVCDPEHVQQEAPGDHPCYAEIVPPMDTRLPYGGYSPGLYIRHCVLCKQEYQGDKRSVMCAPCAYKDKENA